MDPLRDIRPTTQPKHPLDGMRKSRVERPPKGKERKVEVGGLRDRGGSARTREMSQLRRWTQDAPATGVCVLEVRAEAGVTSLDLETAQGSSIVRTWYLSISSWSLQAPELIAVSVVVNALRSKHSPGPYRRFGVLPSVMSVILPCDAPCCQKDHGSPRTGKRSHVRSEN